jgi:hypothetical protein
MRKYRIAGALTPFLNDIRSKLGVPKHQAPNEPFYTCPNGDEDDVHRVDLDEESGQWYCMDCDAMYEGPKHLFRLDELWRIHHLEEATYEGGKPRPVRKNQKITDGELEEYFGDLNGEYVKVARLKKMFGPTPGNPDGLIKINDTDSSTTVISSSFMRRLGKITGKKWTQEKALGEKGENLVRFVQTERPYMPKKKQTIDEKFRDYQAVRRIEKRLEELEEELMSNALPSDYSHTETEKGHKTFMSFDFSKVDEWPIMNREEILRIKEEMQSLERFLGIKPGEGGSELYPTPDVRKIKKEYDSYPGPEDL